ncbi:RNA-binding protein S4 [Weizmannia acidilactici]|uniref:RNA-binding protein S4 n=1 Tax=Weizmannia acidilactici TaxID=2607726 RepID=A0A5J4JIU5_9BACI|nr:RNA-binding protein [Weizmannia acidilactici]GER65538.1 RNA-binding protein S4 [Weizmannia acidilactici]GER70450.1 RNA-binding protein S4 [Weizmannia acidilactici]GER74078.1 RNA-binding protein S4 [Weizmannia acidilactici]
MDSIYQHFRPDEKEFVDKVIAWRQYVEDAYAPKLTDFLDPRMQQIVEMIIGTQSGIRVQAYGGRPESERKRMLLFPDYFSPETQDFQIALFEVEYPSKFVSFEHKHVLGSLMSLGLKREKFGDILIRGGRTQFFIAAEYTDFIQMEFRQIGKTTVRIVKKTLEEAISVEEEWQEKKATVSSLRLDAVLSAIYNISRQKTQMLIGRGLIKVNWKTVEDPAFQCREGDYFSVRGYGRSRMFRVEGKTKKEKWRIVAGILK